MSCRGEKVDPAQYELQLEDIETAIAQVEAEIEADNITQITGAADREWADSQTKCKFCIKTESCMEYDEWEATTVT